MADTHEVFAIAIQVDGEHFTAQGETLAGETRTLIESGNLSDLYALLQQANGFQICVEDGQVALTRDLPARAFHTLLTNTLHQDQQ